MRSIGTTIIIVNFNGHLDTVECLQSILKLKNIDYNVIIVDNSENEESYKFISDWMEYPIPISTLQVIDTSTIEFYSKLDFAIYHEDEIFEDSFLNTVQKFTLIRSKNNGFAAANNIGINYALQKNDFKYIWLLNNDTIIDINSLKELVNQMEESTNIGILGSVLLNYYSPKTLQGIGGYYNKYTGTTKEILNGEVLNKTLLNQSYKINYPIGASLFVKKEFLQDVGLMNEEYFLFFEEIDWTLRGNKYGWECGYAPKSLIWHKGSSTINGKSKSKTKICDYFGLKSKILFTWNFYPLLIPLTYLSIAILLFNRIKKGQFDRVWPLVNISFKPNMTNSSVFNL